MPTAASCAGVRRLLSHPRVLLHWNIAKEEAAPPLIMASLAEAAWRRRRLPMMLWELNG